MITVLLLLGIFYLSLRITQEILSVICQLKVKAMQKKLPYIMELALKHKKIDEAENELVNIYKEIAEL